MNAVSVRSPVLGTAGEHTTGYERPPMYIGIGTLLLIIILLIIFL